MSFRPPSCLVLAATLCGGCRPTAPAAPPPSTAASVPIAQSPPMVADAAAPVLPRRPATPIDPRWSAISLPETPSIDWVTSGDGEQRVTGSQVDGVTLPDGRSLPGTAGLEQVVVTDDLKLLLGTRHDEDVLEVWDLVRGRRIRRVRRDSLYDHHYAASDRLVVARYTYGAKPKLVAEVHAARGVVPVGLPAGTLLGVSPDAASFVVRTDRATLIVRDGHTAATLPRVEVTFSPDGRFAAYFHDETVSVIEVGKGDRWTTPVRPNFAAVRLALDEGGETVVMVAGPELLVIDRDGVHPIDSPPGPFGSPGVRGDSAWIARGEGFRRWDLRQGTVVITADTPAWTKWWDFRVLGPGQVELLDPRWAVRWDLVRNQAISARQHDGLPSHLEPFRSEALSNLRARMHGLELIDVSDDGSRVLWETPVGMVPAEVVLTDARGARLWSGEWSSSCHALGPQPPMFLPGDTAFVTCVGSLVEGVIRDASGKELRMLGLDEPRSTPVPGILTGNGLVARVTRDGVIASAECACTPDTATLHPDGTRLAIVDEDRILRLALEDLTVLSTQPLEVDGTARLAFLPDDRILTLRNRPVLLPAP